MTDLSKKRKKLQTDIRDAVSRFGPELFGEDQSDENWRIIKDEQFEQENASISVTGRFKPYKTQNPWQTPIISDVEWEEIQEILG